jgi:hypothetical protein
MAFPLPMDAVAISVSLPVYFFQTALAMEKKSEY